MKSYRFFIALFITSCLLPACSGDLGDPVVQVPIPRIEQMPAIPHPYKIIDWREKAVAFDSLVYDFRSTVPYGPYIWIDSARRNLPQLTYGLYTAIGDVRQGPQHHNGEFHEALAALNSLLSAGLVGIDKTNQNGFNYVKMIQNYFNSDNGWNIIMNNTCPEVAALGGGYGRDWWYDVYPNVLFYGVSALFPDVENEQQIQHIIAEQFCKADSVLHRNYDYSCFDYSKMKGIRNHIPWQQDAAGGHAYVLYSAYKKFHDPRYLKAAESALDALEKQKESRFYEILLPFGALTAAQLNREAGKEYDVTKLLNWIFEGCQSHSGRYSWGVIAERWGGFDVYGLQGSITDGGGYAFLMNSIAMAWPLVPLVKYEPQYARAIGKWMLNDVNASRLFFPDQIDDQHQWLPQYKNITGGIIGYEGLRKVDTYNKKELQGVQPVALGDGPLWAKGQPECSMFSIYSTSIAGVFGAIVDTTNVKGVLRLNCNATDFYGNNSYPTYLLYNPYNKPVNVSFCSEKESDLFDTVSKRFLGLGVKGSFSVPVPADNAVVIVVLPAGTKLSVKNNQILANGSVIAFK